MKSRIVSFCTVLAIMAVVLGLAGCPEFFQNNNGKKDGSDPVDPADILVTGISLTKSSLTLAVGDLEKLEYTITPSNATNKQVSWSSDKSDVVSVGADGTVTAHKTGEAEITVTTEDGGKTASITVNVVTSVPVTGISLTGSNFSLAVNDTKKLEYTITPANATNKQVSWSSATPAVASVSQNGTVTALTVGTAKITVTTADGGKTAFVTVTVVGQENILSLPPMKDRFTGKFLIGNIFNPGDVGASSVTNTRLIRHFNILTAENNMKPSYIAPSQGSYNFTTADNMVDAAIASGFQVVGHTLLWHSQNAGWMTSANCTLPNMKTYITAVVDHFKGRIYSWDVLNEVFPDGVSVSANWTTAMRSNNPWFASQGSSFVYEGFLAARLADPNAILYYNDYNLDQVGKATMVRNMVRDVNQQYADANPGVSRKLIEGIGMQSHHNTNVQASSIKNTLELFEPLGVKISVSELDVLAQGYSSDLEGAGKPPAAGNNLTLQATRYGEYMKLFLQYANIIERVSIWGITDNQSWRSAGQPLLFDPNGNAKPAYYAFIGALE